MSTNKTQHFGLSQWQSTDPIRVADFNADNLKIDDALAARAQLATGSYTGTGKFGSANPNTLTFPFEPKFVFVTHQSGEWYRQTLAGIRGMKQAYVYSGLFNGDQLKTASIFWDRNTFWWYSSQAFFQLNNSGETYFYIAIG